MNNSNYKIEISNDIISNLFGELDINIKKIESTFDIKIINRDDYLSIIGEDSNCKKAKIVIEKLIEQAKKQVITLQNVKYVISNLDEKGFNDIDTLQESYICSTISGKILRPKTLGQKKYIDIIKNNTIVFGVGPAGTGKTYLAMAMAITAFKNGLVNRIVLTRPAIEAGEKLGFLPGDLQQKVDPYLRPLYDAIYDIMGIESFQKKLEKGVIEVAPLAYMRGRTLDSCFIVLDEAQNTTPEQMKMFLTRIGFGSKVIITGDLTQIDLPYGKKSGLLEALKVLENIDDIGICYLSNKDVVRHPLIQDIIEAYENYEKMNKTKD